jgi:hypothetical protein
VPQEMTWEKACDILDVKPTASQKEIRDQYFYWAQLLHPDKNLNKPESVRKRAEEELKKKNEAYSFLREPHNNPYNNPPKLDVNVRHIRFKDLEDGQTKRTNLEFRSIGGAYTKFVIDPPQASWLCCTAARSLTEKQLPLEVIIEATGFGEAGKKYDCDLIAKLENEQTGLKDKVIIKAELWMKAKPAALDFDISDINFYHVNPSILQSSSFKLRNTGHDLLAGRISTTKAWLAVSPSAVHIPALSEDTYIVNAPASAVPYGYADSCYIHINTNGGDRSIPVYLYVIKEPVYTETKKAKQGFSYKDFWVSFAWFIAYPIIPPIIIAPILLWNWLGGSTVFWVILGIYLLIGLVVSIRKGSKAGREQAVIVKSPPQVVQHNQPASQLSHTVVGNKFRSVYHEPSCQWVSKMSKYNREYLTIEEAKRRGYRRCPACRP